MADEHVCVPESVNLQLGQDHSKYQYSTKKVIVATLTSRELEVLLCCSTSQDPCTDYSIARREWCIMLFLT